MDINGASLILIPIVGAVVLDFFYHLYRRRQRFRDLPKPPHSFLWGHLKLMGEIASQLPPKVHPQTLITILAQKYDMKGIWYLDLWPLADPQVILTEPELMDSVQVTRVYNIHRIAQELMESSVGADVIAVTNGPLWKKLHNAMAPAFLPGQIFSMEHEVSKPVFDMVGRVVLNFPLHAQTQSSDYYEDLKQTIELVNKQLSMNPFTKLLVALKKIPIRKRLDASISVRIRERFAALQNENIVPSRKDPLSILELMLRETVLQQGTGKGAKAAEIPEDELKLLVTNVEGLLLGGMGTTVDTLSYAYMLLSKHPDAVRTLRKEHDANLREFPTKLKELEYTGAVIKETLRLFPVGFGYPVDDLVIVPCWHTMHFDSRYFPERSAFRPERFMGDSVPRGWFGTFSRGSRACLGENLAIDIARVTLLLTMRDFNFDCAGLEPNPKPKSTYTDLDTVFGDIVFQELAIEARPRGGMMMAANERAGDS
ncbi:cytochrome P450 [Hypoxylon sp. NC1633]|nr:cytochrome P450 [Hypoxylon sp. NC1633]